jgi:hypothetical protein
MAGFKGDVVARWLTDQPDDPDGDDRMMELVEPFTFVDAKGFAWTSPAGARIDGASIPQLFWGVISPYIGDYRRASVVHDRYCDPPYRTRSWRDTHRMFHEAMLADGTGKLKAGVMYAAVYAFGPRWPDPASGKMMLSSQEATRLAGTLDAPPADSDPIWSQISARTFSRIARRIENSELSSLAEIEQAIDGAPAARIVAGVDTAGDAALMSATEGKSSTRLSLKKIRPKARSAAIPAPTDAKSARKALEREKDREKDRRDKKRKKKR